MKYLRPKYFLFIFRLVILKLKYRHKVSFTSLKVGFESGTDIMISGEKSSISFGNVNYFYKMGNLEVFDGGKIVFGNNVSINKGFSIVCRNEITFGNDIMIGPNVMIYDHDHKFEVNHLPFRSQKFRSAPISIGDNVWIGAHVFISSGILIGSNCVIAAGTILTKDVTDYSLVGGNPGRVLRKLNV